MDYRTPHAETLTLGAEPLEKMGSKPDYLRFRRPYAIGVMVLYAAISFFVMYVHGGSFARVVNLVAFLPLMLLLELGVRLAWWRRHRRVATAPTTVRRVGADAEIEAPTGTATVPLETVRRTTLAAKGLRGPGPALAFGDAGVVACKMQLPDEWPTKPEVASARWYVDEATFRALEAAFVAVGPERHVRVEVADDAELEEDAADDSSRAVRVARREL